MDKQVLDDYIQSIKSQYDQFYTGFVMHPEEGKESKINDKLTNIKDDLVQIDNALIGAGEQVYKLMTNTILRLNNIHANIMTEKERYQDMQMLCNKYNDYDNVKLLDNNDFYGSFEYDNGVFSPKRTSEQTVNIHVTEVFGNGYEGNKYVYKDYMYTNKILDTSIRTNITDNKITSYYEYSRITVSNTEDACITDFNKDNKEAQCTISFQADSLINEIEITSDDSDIVITNVSYSLDGVEYIDINIPYISINNKRDSYEEYGYIYGSGKIVFPYRTQLFKVTLQSNSYTKDVLAYQKALITEGLYYDETGLNINPDPVETYEVDEITTIIPSGQRHVIKLNDVSAGQYNYSTKCKMQSQELLTQEVYAISLFANVYTPQGIGDDAVKFILTVNGYDFEVVPINSHLNGTKIIRFSTGNGNSPYTERIGEKIKSAYLTVVFTSEKNLAPKINNVKILLGGEL